MATRTVSQTGPLSDAATFGGSAFSDGDDIANPTSNGFTLTIDTNATIAGMGSSGAGNGNGRTIINSGVTVTLTGNVIQGNAKVTLGSGTGDAHLVFDTTAADRKFLFGDADNFTGYANCYLEVLGVSGDHCTITKTGSNYCWFDDFSEASFGGADKGGYDCTYCDFEDIGTSTGSFSLGRNTFGARPMLLDHCTFDGCGVVGKIRAYSGIGGGGFYVRDCRFANATGSYHLEVVGDGSDDSPNNDITDNAFDDSAASVNFNAKIHVTGNFFGRAPAIAGGPWLSRIGNLYHVHSGEEVLVVSDCEDEYWVAALDHPGNPHCFVSGPADGTYDGCIFDYPIAQAIDGGECIYTNSGGITVRNCLAIPSETDGYAIGNIAHHGTIATGDGWAVEHNTIVGRNGYIAYTESGGTALYASVKSNLAVDLSNNDSAAICFDVFEDAEDMVDPAEATHNGMYEQVNYADSLSGETLEGYRSHFNTEPGTSDVIANPNFVDPTRSFANWAVYKGAAGGGDSLATRTAAAVALVFADPTLILSDLIPWVRAGFAPTNAVYEDAGHDAVTIGAVEYQAPATGNRRRRSIICGAAA